MLPSTQCPHPKSPPLDIYHQGLILPVLELYMESYSMFSSQQYMYEIYSYMKHIYSVWEQ